MNNKKIPTLYIKKTDCCGCCACQNICPQYAINMEYDSEGFFYPVIDKDKCIGCKKCVNVCPIQNSFRRSK